MADLRNVIEKIIRLVWDKSAARRAETEAQTSGQRMEAMFSRVGKALAGAFAIRKIIDFTTASVRAAAEQEKVFSRLAATVEQVGVKFSTVERRIRLAQRALSDTAAVSDDEFADALQTLIRLTGNFDTALRNVPLAADIAFGANMSLNSAAELLGRTIAGNTRGLAQLGIKADNAADGLAELQKRFGGMAEREGKSLSNQLATLTKDMQSLQAEFGGLIGDILQATGALDGMKNAARGLTDNIKSLREGIKGGLGRGDLIDLFLDPRSFVTNMVRRGRAAQATAAAGPQAAPGPVVLPGINVNVSAEDARRQADEERKRFNERIDNLIKAAELNRITAAEEAELVRLEKAFNAELAKGIPNLERRLEVVERLARIGEARTTLQGARPGPALPTPQLAPIGSLQLPTIRSAPDAEAAALRTRLGHIEEFYNNQMELAQMAAEFQTEAFRQFFDSMIQGFEAGHNAAQIFADGVVGLGRFVVSQLIEGFAQKEMAMGVAALAAGTFPPNPAALTAASLHFVAAGLFKALGSFVAGGGRSGGGGGSIRPASGSLASTQRAGQTEPATSEIHLHFKGPQVFSPEFERIVFGAVTRAQETAGRTAPIRKHVTR